MNEKHHIFDSESPYTYMIDAYSVHLEYTHVLQT